MTPPSRRAFGLRFAALALALAAFSAAGCGGFVPFTQELRSQHDLRPRDLQNLQFYLSDEIVLRREISSQSRQIAGNHRLVVVSGRTVEEVVIPAHTPGVAVEVGDGSLAIAFEPGSSLLFVPERADAIAVPTVFATPPDPFPGSRRDDPGPEPEPRAWGFEGAYRLALDPSRRVVYQGLAFVPAEASARAHLLIRLKSLDNDVESRKVLSGMKLQGQ